MPSGIYERQVGRTRKIKGAVLELLEAGWSETQVGSLFKIHQTSVARLVKGEWNPRRKQGKQGEQKVRYHAKLLGVPMDQTKGRPQERWASELQSLRTWGRGMLKLHGGIVTITELREEGVETLFPEEKEALNVGGV